jgi:L-asparaginase II
MSNPPYIPVFELTRGQVVESVHFGAAAVSDRNGNLAAWLGDPEAVTFLRSSAKPFQALPFIESGGASAFQLTSAEVALLCASHSGTDEHVETVLSIQGKTGVRMEQLLCGVHPVTHEPTAEAMRRRGEVPTPNRHNCSGKHTGMLAYTHWQGWPVEDYINPSHPVQQRILVTFAEMCGLEPEQVRVGIDGCSAPNFAVPLRNAAMAFARLCDPEELLPQRAEACRLITTAMAANPGMVAGPRRFDTRLMEATGGRLVSKGGAEGYQGVGLLPGALGPGSPALGIAIKVSDGDLKGRALPAITLEILHQLGTLAPTELADLSDLGPSLMVQNWRQLLVGEARPSFRLAGRSKRSDS